MPPHHSWGPWQPMRTAPTWCCWTALAWEWACLQRWGVGCWTGAGLERHCDGWMGLAWVCLAAENFHCCQAFTCVPHGVLFCLQASQHLRDRCHAFLLTQLPPELREAAEAAAGRGSPVQEDGGMQMDGEEGTAPGPGRWGIAPFYVEQRPQASAAARFNFRAPTTGRNALRVLRALQVCIGEGR